MTFSELAILIENATNEAQVAEREVDAQKITLQAAIEALKEAEAALVARIGAVEQLHDEMRTLMSQTSLNKGVTVKNDSVVSVSEPQKPQDDMKAVILKAQKYR